MLGQDLWTPPPPAPVLVQSECARAPRAVDKHTAPLTYVTHEDYLPLLEKGRGTSRARYQDNYL